MSELKIENGKLKTEKSLAFRAKRGSFFTLLIVHCLLLIVLNSCATSSGFTNMLSAGAEIASATGHGKTAAGLTAAASTSKAMEEITPENEYYIGRAVAATILTNYKVYSAPAKESYLNKICNTLAINSEDSEPFNGYHVKILDSNEVNAFATSGGHIFITRGLLACTNSEDSLAGVIAHEMAHIQFKHSLKAIKTSRWTAAGISATSAAVSVARNSASDGATLNDMVGDVVTSMVNNGYSSTQEFDADSHALTLMANAGYNPRAMLDMLGQLKSASSSGSTGMFKTHPTPDKRIEKVNASLTKITLPANTTSYRTARFAQNK